MTQSTVQPAARPSVAPASAPVAAPSYIPAAAPSYRPPAAPAVAPTSIVAPQPVAQPIAQPAVAPQPALAPQPAVAPQPSGQALYDNYGNLIVEDPWVKISDDLGDREWNAVEPYQLTYQVDFYDDYPTQVNQGFGDAPPGTMPPPPGYAGQGFGVPGFGPSGPPPQAFGPPGFAPYGGPQPGFGPGPAQYGPPPSFPSF